MVTNGARGEGEGVVGVKDATTVDIILRERQKEVDKKKQTKERVKPLSLLQAHKMLTQTRGNNGNRSNENVWFVADLRTISHIHFYRNLRALSTLYKTVV
jgi:hypothetical protein